MKIRIIKTSLLFLTIIFVRTVLSCDYYDDTPFLKFRTSTSTNHTSTIAIGATIGSLTGIACNYFEKLGPFHWTVWWFIWRQIRLKLAEAASKDLVSQNFEQHRSFLLATQLPLLLLPHEKCEEPNEAYVIKNSAWITDWLVYLLLKNI